MKNSIWSNLRLNKVSALLAGTLFIFMFFSCANQKPSLSTAFYSFEYEGENYRIRSISSTNNALSFNEIISDKFVAADFDQDGFIDEITLGDISLSEAQKIYEYTLTMLARQDKLREGSPKVNVYKYADSEYNYEIKSFHPADAEPFNQFKIIKNGRILAPPIIMAIDQKADGTVDAIVKGTMALEKIQALYSEVIKKGLEKNELIQIDNMIVVK